MENLRNHTVHADGDGGIIIETNQDITDILERNKALQEVDKARTGDRRFTFNRLNTFYGY